MTISTNMLALAPFTAIYQQEAELAQLLANPREEDASRAAELLIELNAYLDTLEACLDETAKVVPAPVVTMAMAAHSDDFTPTPIAA